MSTQKLQQNIKLNSKSDSAGLSDNDMDILLKATVEAIDDILEKGDTLEIENFGTFSRRKHGSVAVSFFKPSDRLSDRISRKK
ncbi:MAG: HU family DNA-binding protein [Dysgonomonas sp.]